MNLAVLDRPGRRRARQLRPEGTERLWAPQPGPQTAFIQCPYPIILFGGARGGGKTDAVLGKWLHHAFRYGEHAHGIIFRRRYKNLEEVQRRCRQLFPKIGAWFVKSAATWHFPNGATFKMRHLWDVHAAEEYLGHQYTLIVYEEVTQWADFDAIEKVNATLRSAHGVPGTILYTGNPGGPLHNAVKAYFRIGEFPRGYQPIVDEKTGQTRVFIPSRLEDNKILMQADPEYERRLLAVGGPALVKAWRWGSWDIIAGGFFDDIWNPKKHILPVFEPPPSWRWRRSFDWGSSAPSSLGIWSISDGTPVPQLGGFVFPRGSMIRMDEWYTVQHDEAGLPKPNKGLRLGNSALGEGIALRSRGRDYSGCVADPAIFSDLGRPSIYEDIQQGARDAGHELHFDMADNNRKAGWMRMRDMIENAAQDHPENAGVWVTDRCHHFLRTFPVLQRDEKDPDDVNTKQEDHCADDGRYCVMSTDRELIEGTYFLG